MRRLITVFIARTSRTFRTLRTPRTPRTLPPVRRLVILQELTPHMRTGVEAIDDWIHDARGTVDDVERRMEALLGRLADRDLHGIFVRYPSRVHAVHVDAIVMVIGGRRARHHVERRL